VVVNLPGTFFLLKSLLENQKYFQIDFVKLRGFLKESIPIYGFVLFSIIYLQVEIILIEFFLDKSSVGLYSAAVRLTRPMELIPSLLITAFFPIIVKNIANNKSNNKVVKSNINLLNFVSITFACLVFFKSDMIVKLVFGNDFINSSQATSFLAISLVFSFLIFYFLDLLTAYGKQKFNLIYIIFVLVLNFLLNVSLIPKYGIEGAALTKILSTLIGFIFLLIIVSKNTNVIFSSLFSSMVYLFILTTLIFFISNLNIYLYLGLSIIAIGFSVIISRIIDINELKVFFNSLTVSKNG
jgi:O-antigen/teichoic acid export membrane protein